MTNDALALLVSSIRGRCVLVVGDVMLDEYLWGDVHRISPEAPVPIVEMRRRSYRPGGTANVAANIRSLGGEVLLAGIVGPDTVIGVLALGLAAGASLEATAWASNRAAGVVVGKVGTTTVSAAELLGVAG
jgi:bifunctional ADP-heptose synthase (sugar kinase/adenylyltransferase)